MSPRPGLHHQVASPYPTPFFFSDGRTRPLPPLPASSTGASCSIAAGTVLLYSRRPLASRLRWIQSQTRFAGRFPCHRQEDDLFVGRLCRCHGYVPAIVRGWLVLEPALATVVANVVAHGSDVIVIDPGLVVVRLAVVLVPLARE